MVSIKEVDLGGLGVTFPADGVGMVLAQPYLSLDHNPPFACAADHRERLMECIDATLDISRQRHHGAPVTHFTVFPECTIPGLAGIAKIDAALVAADWPTSTIVLAGIEGMTPDQFRELVAMPDVFLDAEANSLDRLHADHWVNCSVTWVKLPTGEVRRWVQPKISPAWVERNVESNAMYCGSSIFVFKGRFETTRSPFRFHSLLCFDWTGVVGTKRIWEWVLASTNEAAERNEGQLPLTWVFLMQCNDEPCHASFMGQVQPFFNQGQYASVNRGGTCLVMANVAGRDRPGRVSQFGRSALIHAPMRFAKPSCASTYCNGGERYRPGNPLENFSDSLFRESGACIHSFIQADPISAPQGAAGRSVALRNATVHPFPGTDDPRANGGGVPAVIKWLQDHLDEDRSLAKKHPGYALANASKVLSAATTATLRTLDTSNANKSIRLASSELQPERTADEWSAAEAEAVEHVHHTLSLLQLAGHECVVPGAVGHATVLGDQPFDIIAVRGSTHSQSETHVTNSIVRSRMPLVIVSRDQENTVWGREDRRFLDTSDAMVEVDITDPQSATRRIGYQTLVEAFRKADSVEKLKQDLYDALY
jgi:hypothetical protein